MIASGLFLLGQMSRFPTLVEVADPKATYVAIEALVNLPPLDGAQSYLFAQAIQNAVGTLPSYTPKSIAMTMAPGYSMRIQRLPDVLRIGLTVDPRDLGAGVALLTSVLTEPNFLASELKFVPAKPNLGWSRVYETITYEPFKFKATELAEIWHYAIRPANTVIGVRGAFRSADLREKLKDREREWNEFRVSKFPPKVFGKPQNITGVVPIVTFRQPLKSITAIDFLAACALGSGKDSLLWNTSREKLRLSYQQECFFVPAVKGWEMRIALGTDESGATKEKVNKLRDELLSACEAMGEKDLGRAKGRVKSFLEFGLAGSPIFFGSSSLISDETNERLFRDLYWKAHEGKDWDQARLISEANAVPLSALKARIKEILTESKLGQI